MAQSRLSFLERYFSSIGQPRWDSTSRDDAGGSSIRRNATLERLSMTLIPKDMTPVYKATIAKGTSAMRRQRATYVDLLPPCNNACPAGLNIQAWLSLAQAGRYEEAWR